MRAAGVAIAIAAASTTAFALGYLAHRNEWIPERMRTGLRTTVRATPTTPDARPPGEWYPHIPRRRPTPPDDGLTEEDRETLASIGYLAATQTAHADAGVTLHDQSRAQAGVNLYISGHAPQAILMDMDGTALHEWTYPFEKLWPGYEPPSYIRITGHQYWRRVHLFPNGDLLALHEGIGLVKLNRRSELLWKTRDNFHHDFTVTPDGHIYILNRTMEARPEGDGDGEPFIMAPLISILDSGGHELRRIDLVHCFRNSPFAPTLDRLASTGDLFHTNTIQVFDGSLAKQSPFFRKGNILISIWTLDTIAIIDPEKEQIVWSRTGMWRRQHEPRLLPGGAMILFDNRGNAGRSRILEFDPLTGELLWTYAGEHPNDFHSEWCGAVQRLSNGNTLITETNNGRAFEVTSDGAVVWEFVNPHQIQQNGRILVASLWEMTRLPEDFAAGWK